MFNLLQITTTLLVELAGSSPRAGITRKNEAQSGNLLCYPNYLLSRLYDGGISEPVSIILTATLLWLTPAGSAEFWLTLLALIGLIGMQAVYWLITHPVNQFWVEGESLDRFSSGFFTFGTRSSSETDTPVWTELRDRWEYSHVARAVFGLLSLVALLITLA
ncbi:MAG: anthrone oxygenase family protein [Thainema sp.]